jgi:hypothetical protein
MSNTVEAPYKSFHLNVEFFPEIGSWFADKYQQGRKALALRQLEANMAKIVTTHNGHRKNNVPKHAEVYAILLRKAHAAIVEYCTTYKVPVSEIRSQMPALVELEDFGRPEDPKTPKSVVIAIGLMASIAAIISTGALSGGIARLFHLGYAISQYHLK